jgi:hypothetical protein
MAMELDLLLRTGRAKDVRDWTDPEQAAALGQGNFRWLRAQAFAASGNYAAADEELALIVLGGADPEALRPRALLAALVGQQVALEGRLWGTSLPELIRRVTAANVFQERSEKLTGRIRQTADVGVMRGLLALEQGRMEEAEAAFRQALAHWRQGAPGGIDFDARVIAEGWLSKLQ